MPNYTVRTWRPSIDAATPQEAAQNSITLPAVAGDEFYVIENDPAGSMLCGGIGLHCRGFVPDAAGDF
jgi:hypothetical protein